MLPRMLYTLGEMMFAFKKFMLLSLTAAALVIGGASTMALGAKSACAQGGCKANERWCCKSTGGGNVSCSCQFLCNGADPEEQKGAK